MVNLPFNTNIPAHGYFCPLKGLYRFLTLYPASTRSSVTTRNQHSPTISNLATLTLPHPPSNHLGRHPPRVPPSAITSRGCPQLPSHRSKSTPQPRRLPSERRFASSPNSSRYTLKSIPHGSNSDQPERPQPPPPMPRTRKILQRPTTHDSRLCAFSFGTPY